LPNYKRERERERKRERRENVCVAHKEGLLQPSAKHVLQVCVCAL